MKRSCILLLTLLSTPTLFGQPATDTIDEKNLFGQIMTADSLFFQSLNDCDLNTYASFLTEDFEFYHDKGGLTKSREAEMQSMTSFCGEQRQRQHLRRELIAGSVEISPIKDFGAVETGRHRFYLVISDQQQKVIEEAKFLHVWQQQPDGWKLSRVVSYDHQPVSEVELPDAVLDQYVGSYQMTEHNTAVITRNKKLLHVQQGSWGADLYPESNSLFYLNYGHLQMEFIEGRNGRVKKVVIYENEKMVEQGERKH